MARPRTQETGIDINMPITALKGVYEDLKQNKLDWMIKLGRQGYETECGRVRQAIRRRRIGIKEFSKYAVDMRNKMVKRNREKMLADFGSTCSICGFQGHHCQMDFHHTDPSRKEINIAHMIYRSNYAKMKAELSKCILICSNCHRLIHWNLKHAKEE